MPLARDGHRCTVSTCYLKCSLFRDWNQIHGSITCTFHHCDGKQVFEKGVKEVKDILCLFLVFLSEFLSFRFSSQVLSCPNLSSGRAADTLSRELFAKWNCLQSLLSQWNCVTSVILELNWFLSLLNSLLMFKEKNNSWTNHGVLYAPLWRSVGSLPAWPYWSMGLRATTQCWDWLHIHMFQFWKIRLQEVSFIFKASGHEDGHWGTAIVWTLRMPCPFQFFSWSRLKRWQVSGCLLWECFVLTCLCHSQSLAKTEMSVA